MQSMLDAVQLSVLRLQDINCELVIQLLGQFGLSLSMVPSGKAIPGSHWGDDEAGLIKDTLYARTDTPVHSVLHEACHWILMDERRRATLHTDAGGSSTEENAVCYLQILLSAQVPEMGRDRMCRDMDSWGYSFRLGSTIAWFESDADDAIGFLQENGFGQLLQSGSSHSVKVE